MDGNLSASAEPPRADALRNAAIASGIVPNSRLWPLVNAMCDGVARFQLGATRFERLADTELPRRLQALAAEMGEQVASAAEAHLLHRTRQAGWRNGLLLAGLLTAALTGGLCLGWTARAVLGCPASAVQIARDGHRYCVTPIPQDVTYR